MAGKLDDMIAPDELVVHRARYGFRDVLTNLILISAWSVFLWQAVLWLVGYDWGHEPVLALIIVAGGRVTWSICTTTAVVTNRRLLYKTGVIRPTTQDIPLTDVERVDCIRAMPPFRQGTIRVHAGEIITFHAFPNGEHVCAAIRGQLGLPKPPESSTQVIIWTWVMINFCLVVGLCVMIEVANLYSHAYEWAATRMSVLTVFLGTVLLLPPLIGIAIVIVFVGSSFLALTTMRVFLSVDEAKQMICADYRSFSGRNWGDRLARRLYWLSERYVSLLYGQPIRCEDDE